jgi:hypothetical protein
MSFSAGKIAANVGPKKGRLLRAKIFPFLV